MRLILLLCLLLARPAFAEVPGLSMLGGSFDEVRRGIDALAASGSPRAAPVLEALAAGKLFTRAGATPIIQGDGGAVDAETGQVVAEPGALRPVRLNNAVRRSLDAAIGGVRLFSPDAGTRSNAAEAVFRSRDAAAVPALDRALAAEKDSGVATTMREARAAAVLASPEASEADRLAAIATLRARGDLDAKSMLSSLPGGQAPAVAAAAMEGAQHIERMLQIWSLAQGVFYGVSLGSVLLLAATGLAITFGVMGVINMAHGEMVDDRRLHHLRGAGGDQGPCAGAVRGEPLHCDSRWRSWFPGRSASRSSGV